MKKIELVYREILDNALEKNTKKLTQLEIARKLKISLSTVNHALKPLKETGAIEIKLKNFTIIDPEKILYYWASIRNLQKDIVYQTRAEKEIKKIEAEMPAETIFGAYTAYKYLFKDVPADYSEVYVYGDEEEIKKRFPQTKKQPNLYVLKKDRLMKEKTTSTAHTFVDLWNLKEWYAKEFLEALKNKIKKII